ncbi:MAG: hypothetical protein OXP09_21505 [Gammaproteobacteria bacterium]|nr:hypothetical protein [Gammaproteobacteria bacterium]
MTKPKPPIIEVPPEDYEPTPEEMEEIIKIDIGDMTVEEAVQTFLRTPVEVREKQAKYRKGQ